MKLTDKEAIKAMEKVRCLDLEEMLYDYPDDERDGRTDWEMIAEEAGWLLDSFNDDSHANNEALQEARQILRETKYGKRMPIDIPSFKPRYKEYDIKWAKDIINMYNRLTRFVQKLKGMGLYCPYC